MGLASKLQAAGMASGAGIGSRTAISAGQNFNQPSSNLPQSSYAPTPSQYNQGQQQQQPGSYNQSQQSSSYGQSQSSYGQGAGSYGQGPSSYGAGAAPYGQAPNSYGQAPTSYGAGASSYGQGPGNQNPQASSGQQRPGQQGQYGQSSYGQAPQNGQGNYPPQQGGYGQPQYGQLNQNSSAPGGQGPPQAQGQHGSQLFGLLEACVRDQGIGAFYSPSSLQQIAAQPDLMPKLQSLARDWQLPMEVAIDIIKISLFDTIILVDDSGSMSFEENGERIEDMKSILAKVAHATSLFDADGIQVRFLNSNVSGDNIRNEGEVAQLVRQVQFSGLTPLGTSLERKILEPLILNQARQQQLRKPVVVIIITDGAPAGEDRNKINHVIDHARRELSRTKYGPDAVSFSFVQVGTDMASRDFLSQLDSDPTIGKYIDCTSNYELECDEMMKLGVQNFSPSVYLVKLLLGSIDSSYDTKDERR